MTKETWEFWCQKAVAQIKYGPDRRMVQRELADHMEDHYEAYLAAGLSETEAEVRALEAMGSAEEIAPRLAEIHRPFWGYLLSGSRYLWKCLAVLLIVPLLSFWGQLELRDRDTLYASLFAYDPYAPDGAYGPQQYQGGPPVDAGRSILYLEPGVQVSSDGYTFCIARAAVWKHTVKTTIHFQMTVTGPAVWEESSGAPRWFWAVDSDGNRYPCMYESSDQETGISVAEYRTGLWEYTYEMWIEDFPGEEIRWIRLHYDRAGRDLVLQVDLTEEVGP